MTGVTVPRRGWLPALPVAGPLGAVVALTAFRWFLVARFELAPDEAYYLSWASLGAGPDHPPLIGWLARGALALSVHPVERAARVAPVLCGLAAAVCLDRLAVGLGASQRARWVLVTLGLLPLPAAGALLFTPDVPLYGCVAGLLLATLCPGGRPWLRGTVLVTLSAMAVLAKVNAVLVIPALLAARWVLGAAAPEVPAGMWVAAAVAQCGALIPGLTSLRFQWLHAFTAVGPTTTLAAVPPFPFAGVIALVSGQLGLLVPALGLVPGKLASPPVRALAMAALVPSVPVLVSALVRIPEPNWTAPAWPCLLVAMALASDGLTAAKVRRWTGLTVVVAVALHTQLVMPWLPLPPRSDPTARLRGWRIFCCDHGPLPAEGLPPYAIPAEQRIYAPRCHDRGVP